MNKKNIYYCAILAQGYECARIFESRACMVARVLEASKQPFAALVALAIVAFAVLCAAVRLVELGYSIAFWLDCLWGCFRSRQSGGP